MSSDLSQATVSAGCKYEFLPEQLCLVRHRSVAPFPTHFQHLARSEGAAKTIKAKELSLHHYAWLEPYQGNGTFERMSEVIQEWLVGNERTRTLHSTNVKLRDGLLVAPIRNGCRSGRSLIRVLMGMD